MEPITIKARLNQAYHFSGAAGNGIRFSDLSDDPAFVFREDTSAVHNRFVPAGGRISYASPVRLTRDALPVPPLSLCRIRKRHFNDCRRRCAGARNPASLHRGISCFFRIRPHTGFPRRIPLSATTVFICPQSIFRNIFRFCVRTTAFFIRTGPRRMTSYGVFCPASPASCSPMNQFPRFI